MIHEVAHGSVAYQLGDPTAKYAGRLSLNPIKHIDPFGTVLLPLMLLFLTAGNGPVFGWAKPVPVNPFNFKDQKWGDLKVSIAGPLANFSLALVFGLFIRFFTLSPSFEIIFSLVVIYNLLLGLFNLIPIPPLDGSHILFSFLPERYREVKIFLRQYGFFILVFFIFFGLSFLFKAAIFLYSLISGEPML
jgi:Zn-dependent protease